MMKTVIYIIVSVLIFISCNKDEKKSSVKADTETEIDSQFNSTKWAIKEGLDYPYRDQMLEHLVYHVKLKGLTKEEILAKLGQPDRIDNGHLYYLIEQKRFGFFPLHTKTLVIKLAEDGTVEWRKIHK